MTRTAFAWLASLLLLAGCAQKAEDAGAPPPAAPARMAMAAPELMQAKAGAADAAPRRYVALSHRLVVDTAAAGLPTVFDDAVQRCLKAGCEVLESSLQRETGYTAPSASLSARMPPAAVAAFLDGFGREAEVVEHHRSAEDKTDAVIDTEARISNLTELRDRLRAMLATRGAGLKEVIEVERELANTQAQLDSLAGLRKALANETDKVAVHVVFRTRPALSERSFFGPVAAAWDQAGGVLMRSLGALITFVAAVLPWSVILLPAAWGLRAVWRRWRSRRGAQSAGPAGR